MKPQLPALLLSVVAALILAACTPVGLAPAAPAPATSLPQVAQPAAATQPSTSGWQTYTNPAGFSIQYPPAWTQTELAPSATAQGVALSGAEGTVELWWGTGFGGACPQGYTTVKVSGGELRSCYTVGADGIKHWEQMNKELSATSFSGRAYTADAKQASADLVVAVLGTLSFGQAAAPAPTQTAGADPGLTDPVTGGIPLQDALASLTPQDVWQSTVTDRYPGWTPNPDSPLLHLFMQSYEQLYTDKQPTYTAIHAGLECGTVASKYPEMDFISLGPTLIDVHTADERLQVSTVPRVVDLIVAVLGGVPAK